MKIILNDELQQTPVHERTQATREQRRASGHKEFAERFIGKMSKLCAPKDPSERWPRPDAQVVRGLGDHQMTQNGFANVVSEAYSTHLGLVLHPHDIWYVVLANISAIVGEKPDFYRNLYTTSDEKQEILVIQDHPTDINIEALIAKLGEKMPVDISLFLPELSTATPEAKLAMSAAVLDAAKHYYDYGMFCCGIPYIDLRGTKEDWMALENSVIGIIVECSKGDTVEVGLRGKLTKYLGEVQKVLINIAASYDVDNTEFWKDIFTQKNVGSGGDLVITGWICDLYHTVKRGDMIKSFHDGISSFPYENKTTNQHFMMYHGAFGSNVVDGAIEIAYDHVTIEYKPKEA